MEIILYVVIFVLLAVILVLVLRPRKVIVPAVDELEEKIKLALSYFGGK